MWVCAGCRSSYDLQAMLSSTLACTDCRETQEWTLQVYCDMWIRGILIKGMMGYNRERDTTPVNFPKLGEMMLSPHGVNTELEHPDHREKGDDATCACEAV